MEMIVPLSKVNILAGWLAIVAKTGTDGFRQWQWQANERGTSMVALVAVAVKFANHSERCTGAPARPASALALLSQQQCTLARTDYTKINASFGCHWPNYHHHHHYQLALQSGEYKSICLRQKMNE